MTWWCSAQDIAWSWQWRAYPGVWLFVLALGAGYLWVLRAAAAAGGEAALGRKISFGAGLLLLWAVTDWPIGALGAGYLLSVHTGQYLLYSLVIPPLLLGGLPPAVALRPPAPSPTGRLLRWLARPVPALVIYHGVLVVTHLPPVVDRFRPTQWGSFVIDVAWLVGGLVFWWPLMAPNPGVSRVTPPWQIGYLFLSTILPTIPAAFLTFADYPIYRLYELAPRVGLAAGTDQQIAGLAMKALADPLIWIAMAVVFFRWHRREDAADRAALAAAPVRTTAPGPSAPGGAARS